MPGKQPVSISERFRVRPVDLRSYVDRLKLPAPRVPSCYDSRGTRVREPPCSA